MKIQRILIVISVILLLAIGASYFLSMYFSLMFEWFFMLSAALVSVASLIITIFLVVSFQNKKRFNLMGCIKMIVVVLIGVFFLYWYLHYNHHFRTRNGVEFSLQSFMEVAGEKTLSHVEKTGIFPDSDKWCNTLLTETKSYYFSSDIYRRITLNENISHLKINDVSPDTVLLIEADGPGSSTGGKELIYSRRERDQYYPKRDRFVFVFFVDATLAKYRLRDGSIAFYESDKNSFSGWYKKGETSYSPLRWEGSLGKEFLTKEDIISIANEVAKKYCVDFNERYLKYDKDNKRWYNRFSDTDPNLVGHEFQVVLYERSDILSTGGPFWICIDKKTGEVLKFIGEL